MLGLDGMIDRFQLWRAMRAMRAEERRDAREHYWDFKNLVTEAKDNFERGNRTRALEVWTTAYAAFPDLAATSAPALDFLVSTQRYEEAEALLTKGLQRHSRDPHFPEGLALVAYKRGDRENAIRICTTLRKKFPGSLKGYWIAAAALSELGRTSEAEAVMAHGLRTIPNDTGLLIEYAKLAERRKDWKEALTRWTEVHEKHLHLAGTVGVAHALTELGNYAEADAILESVKHRVGNSLAVWSESARISERQGNWEEANLRWAKFRDRFPLETYGYTSGLRPLLEMRSEAAAEAIVLQGIDRIPDDPAPLVEYAMLAHRRGDWTEAVARWAAVCNRFPDHRAGRDLGEQARTALQNSAVDGGQ